MGASESVPIVNVDNDIEEDGGDAGFAGRVTESQEAAAEAAAVAAAALNLAHEPAAAAPTSRFVVTAAEGEPIAASLDEYRMEKKVLGEGAFGKVKLATSEKSGHKVAVKIIKRNKINARAEELLVREVKHHEKLRHTNIVRLYTWIKAPSKYYLVMEFCPKGDLLGHLNRAGTLSDPACRAYFGGLMQGIVFCHGLGIHHRDIKLENLMLCPPPAEGDELVVKIADFGLSDLVDPGDLSGTFCGSPLYAAPELMTAGAAPDGYDASRSDVWSCGVVLYALLCSALPFDAADIQSLVRLIQRGEPTAPVPRARGAAAAALIKAMMAVDPKARPAAADVLADAWLQDEGAAQPIKSAATVPEFPVAADPEAAAEVPDAPPQASPERRRGATETTEFFKRMISRERLAEATDADAAAAAEASAPAVAGADAPRQKGAALTKEEREQIRAERELTKAQGEA